jgi:uncharacterized membrane protein
VVHPFYGPSGRLVGGRETRAAGLLSMVAYLAFWGAALAMAKRELDARWPRSAANLDDPARPGAVLRERYARGEIDEATFRHMSAVLAEPAAARGAG